MMGRKVLEVLDIILKIPLWFIFVFVLITIFGHPSYIQLPGLQCWASFFFFFFAVKGLEATNYDLKSKTKELLQDLTLPLHLPRKIMKYMVVS